MRKYIYVGCGGFAGAILRFIIGHGLTERFDFLPVGTLLINISGTLLLSFVMTAALDWLPLKEDARFGITVGFFGAYTTFSTLCRESVGLLERGAYFTAFAYLFLSVSLGFAAVFCGMALSRTCGKVFSKSPKGKITSVQNDSNHKSGGKVK